MIYQQQNDIDTAVGRRKFIANYAFGTKALLDFSSLHSLNI